MDCNYTATATSCRTPRKRDKIPCVCVWECVWIVLLSRTKRIVEIGEEESSSRGQQLCICIDRSRGEGDVLTKNIQFPRILGYTALNLGILSPARDKFIVMREGGLKRQGGARRITILRYLEHKCTYTYTYVVVIMNITVSFIKATHQWLTRNEIFCAYEISHKPRFIYRTINFKLYWISYINDLMFRVSDLL